MAFPKTLKSLCTPAYFYFVISVIALVVVLFQNLGNSNVYSLGSFTAKVPSTTMVFIVKFIYILFWTWILNLICRDGHSGIAWFLVLLPFILFFIILALIWHNQ